LGERPHLAVGTYESFLFLLGSVFVPLFGVFVADYFLLGRRGRLTEEMFDGGTRARRSPRFNPAALGAWVAGFLMYQWSWSVPPGLGAWTTAMRTLFHSWLRLPYPLAGSKAGASIPSFLATMAIYAVGGTLVRRRSRRRAEG
jgi:purine-cytosine permease-like protein